MSTAHPAVLPFARPIFRGATFTVRPKPGTAYSLVEIEIVPRREISQWHADGFLVVDAEIAGVVLHLTEIDLAAEGSN